jgi:hypothetical protein
MVPSVGVARPSTAFLHNGVMRFGRTRGEFPKHDAGSGALDDYRFDLSPKSSKTVIRLAGSDPHQADIDAADTAEQLEAVIARRTLEEERTDAPMPVRLFADGRVLGPVGQVPRGLEGVVNEAISRLEMAGRKPRIPADVVRTRHGLRVDLLIGRTT